MKAQLQILFKKVEQHLNEHDVHYALLVELLDILRPENPCNQKEIHDKLQQFIEFLDQEPSANALISQFLLELFSQYRQVDLYTESGILSSDGFTSQLQKRIGQRILPLLEDEKELKDILGKLFYKESDVVWIENISTEDNQALLKRLMSNAKDERALNIIRYEILKSVQILSYRISSIGIHPELHYVYPELGEVTSPFLVQNRELVQFIEQVKGEDGAGFDFLEKEAQWHLDEALVMLDQCRMILQKVRRSTKRLGVSLSLTYLLAVLEQSLNRIENLLIVIYTNNKRQQVVMHTLLARFVRANYDDKSVRALLRTNTELLALQITENASQTGEHYVSTDKKGYFAMYRRAAGAGVLIAIMSVLKLLASSWQLAPFAHAFVYSMIYGLGFVVIHMLHFTVATKQPAMTAAALAATIQNSTGSKNAKLAELAALIINIWRTQFVAIMGNITVAIPVALLICFCWADVFGGQMINYVKANHLLEDLNPFTSLALPHAAIAGVCLFLSGLITGYYDNLAIYRKLADRIKADVRLQKRFTAEKLDKFAHYIENNLGAIMGNFLFGVMLGSMGTLGLIFGLPLDIRHIAFSSANWVQGLFYTNSSFDISLAIICLLGVLLIGMVNLLVSFSLTIIVALRSRRVKVNQWSPLIKLILTHFAMRPSDFFWPPKQSLKIDELK